MIDYRTVALLMPLAGVCVTLGLFLYWRSAPWLAGLAHWVAGFALFSAGNLLWAMRPLLPSLVSATLGSFLALAGLAVLWTGLGRYTGAERPWRLPWAVVAAGMIAHLPLQFAGLTAPRIGVTNLAFGMLILGLAVAFWRLPLMPWLRRFAALANGITATGAFGRSVYYLDPDRSFDLFASDSLLAGPMFLEGFVWLLVLGFSFLALAGARNEAALRQSLDDLQAAKQETETALAEAARARADLMHRDRTASLGQMVAGLAQEVHAPIGTALTASSFLSDEVARLDRAFAEGALRRSDMAEFLADAREAAAVTQTNVGHTAELLQGFREVTGDQVEDMRRRFDLGGYLAAATPALRGPLDRDGHALALDCPAGIELDSYPGTLLRVLGALVGNAAAHAFPDGGAGTVTIAVSEPAAGTVRIDVTDDGAGMTADTRTRALDPFFTTGRPAGHSGLGLHSVQNLVENPLGGALALETTPGAGTRLTLELPQSAPA